MRFNIPSSLESVVLSFRGGKSIHAVSILAELENYHIYLDFQIIENHQTITGIARYIDKHPTRVRPTEEGKRKKVFGG